VIGFPPEGDTFRSRRLAATRKKIWSAALQTIISRGWERTRILDITRLAGVSHPTFLRYFSSKEDLIRQGARHYVTDIIQAIDDIPRDIAPFPALRQSLVPLADRYARSHQFLILMELFWSHPAMRDIHSSVMYEERARLAQYFDLRLGIRDRLSFPSDLFANTAIMALDYCFQVWFRRDLRNIVPVATEIFSTLASLPTYRAAR
jgi:AcrR family transcriptional regulator